MSFCKLPIELFLIIATKLSPRDVVALAATSSRFYPLAQQYLYCNLQFSFPKETQKQNRVANSLQGVLETILHSACHVLPSLECKGFKPPSHHICELKLQARDAKWVKDERLFTFLIASALREMPGLQNLTWEIPIMPTEAFWAYLSTTKIETLSFRVSNGGKPHNYQTFSRPCPFETSQGQRYRSVFKLGPIDDLNPQVINDSAAIGDWTIPKNQTHGMGYTHYSRIH